MNSLLYDTDSLITGYERSACATTVATTIDYCTCMGRAALSFFDEFRGRKQVKHRTKARVKPCDRPACFQGRNDGMG